MSTRSKASAADDGRFAYEGLDRAIHEKVAIGDSHVADDASRGVAV